MKSTRWFAVLLLSVMGMLAPCAHSAPTARPTAPWPPPEGKLRIIIDTDAANEVDDQFALALGLGMPQRLQIEGIIAAHFGKRGGRNDIERSEQEIHRVLEKAGLAGKFSVKRGVDAIVPGQAPASSDGIDFIIERAKTATPEDPIWIILLGPATDAVAALHKAPEIADRVIVFWHGRSDWPKWCKNFNAMNDTEAARKVFDLPCRFVLFDTGTFLTMPMEESAQRIAPLGPLGAYLHEFRTRTKYFSSPTKGLFDLGDIAALVDPKCLKAERIQAPQVTAEMRYDFEKKQGEIVRLYDVDRDACFKQLEEALNRLMKPAGREAR